MIPLPKSLKIDEVDFVDGVLTFVIDNPTEEQVYDLEQFNKAFQKEQKSKELPYF